MASEDIFQTGEGKSTASTAPIDTKVLGEQTTQEIPIQKKHPRQKRKTEPGAKEGRQTDESIYKKTGHNNMVDAARKTSG